MAKDLTSGGDSEITGRRSTPKIESIGLSGDSEPPHAGHCNGVDLLCARSFRYHPFPSFYSRPSLGRRPPKRRSARRGRVSPPAARAWLFPVNLPPLRPASRFWNRAETPPMQAPPLFWHCP